MVGWIVGVALLTASQTGDFYSLTTFDGQVLTFPNQDMALVDWGSFGAPPVQWITKQGYRQHGETEVGYVLQKRPLTLHLHYSRATTRQQYWQNRALLMDFLRHNRLGPMVLTVQYTQTSIDPSNAATSFVKSNATINTAVSGVITLQTGNVNTFPINSLIVAGIEYMLVVSYNSSTSMNVLRAQNGSSQSPHGVGTPIYYNPPISRPALRSIVVRADPGMKLDADPDRESNWYLDENLSFIAFNPIWYDPITVALSIAPASQQNLVFPITFPIIFGVAGFLFTQVISYLGTWYSYPTITLTGPYTSCFIQNVNTGISITMAVPLAAGKQRVITTQPGNLSVLDQSGNNFFGELGPTSDLVDFNIRPAPEVAGGVNNINVSMYGSGIGSSAQISYNAQYIGI